MTTPDILDDIFKELARAKKKHPNWPDHPAGQAGIVCEESGELMKACLQKKYQRKELTDNEHRRRMRSEAIQVVVTAIRFLENLK
jgi:hypothetical protein